MKRLLSIIAAIICAETVLAQVPQKMSCQAVVRNTGGSLVTNQSVGMKISILQGSPAGSVVYTEIRTPATNANGLISIEIGGGEGFSSIDWANGPYFLKTETDPGGGTNYTITGISELLSVPYALRSDAAETADNAMALTGDQTIAGNKTFTGTFAVPAPVNLTDAATKAYVDALLTKIQQLEDRPGILKDSEGNIYTTIKIGSQVWMGENLRTTIYKDGTAIPLVTDNTAWGQLYTPGYCWYNNDPSSYKSIYGALYNWHTVNTGKLCPAGWHVPTDAEWTTLTTYLGGEAAAGGKLKGTGTVYWQNPNTGATNETGFTALPGGTRSATGLFLTIGQYGQLWSATAYSNFNAWSRSMIYNYSNIYRNYHDKNIGFSVRCLKD